MLELSELSTWIIILVFLLLAIAFVYIYFGSESSIQIAFSNLLNRSVRV